MNGSTPQRSPKPIPVKLFVFTGMVLVAALAFTALPQKRLPHFTRSQPLGKMLSAVECPGWESEERPLGDTEFLAKEVEKTLRFDDAAYRVFRKNGEEVGVYLAYWDPGKLDPWIIALHTPDSCWVLAGAEMLKRDDHWSLAGDQRILEGKYRLFRWNGGAATEVVFWHLYGGKVSGFPVTGEEGRLRARWTELLTTLRNTQMGRVQKEQVFVRISTNRSIASLTASDLWPVLMKALAPTGVVADHSGITRP